MKKIILASVLLSSGIGFSDHPKEGSENLPDLIQEALAGSPIIRSKTENLAASESLIQAKKSRYYPEFKFVAGRKAVKDKSMEATSLRSYSQIDSKINLYQGGLTNAEVSVFETERNLAQEEAAAKRIEIASAVATSFFDLQYTLEGLSIVEKVFVELRDSKNEAVKRIKTGQVAKSESIQFDLLEVRLKTERAVFQEQEVELNQRLRFLLARPDSKPLQIKGHLGRQRWSINSEDAFSNYCSGKCA
jgi:outer membrane protein TolC